MSLFLLRHWVVIFIQLYSWAVIIYTIMGYFRLAGPALSIYRFFETICEPFVGAIRRRMKSVAVGGMGIDFSPLIAIIILWLAQVIISSIPL